MKFLKRLASALVILAGSHLTQSPAWAQAPEVPPTAAPAPTVPPLIATADFVDPGYIRAPIISPDGKWLAYREIMGKEAAISIKAIDGGQIHRIMVPKKHTLNWYRWAGNDQIILSLTGVGSVFGLEVPVSGLKVFEPFSKNARSLGLSSQGLIGDDVLYVDPDGKYLLMSIQPSVFEYPSVYHITIADNVATKIVKAQSDIWDWIADDQGVVRIGIAYGRSSIKIHYRSKDGDKFAMIGKVNEKDDDDKKENSLLEITRVVSGKDEGYILSNKETGRFAVHKFNYLTREIGEKVFGHDENDVTDFELSDDGTAIESVRYTDERDRIVWFDDYFKKQQVRLDKTLPGQEAWIQSHSKDRNRMLIFSTSPTDPGSYYMYDAAAKQMQRVGGINDKLNPDLLAETKYVRYSARDGLSIPAYLTLPKGRDPKMLPLIILPHGGPFGVRDTLDYNTEVQFLANRGYAVLQPNYRGSDSYGEAFYKKGEGQLGRTMQDDLDDGMDWLAKEGIIDPARVCIAGASYGGYAALWGVIRNPERYRCAASFAGVTDFKKQIKYDSKSLKSRYAKEWRSQVQGEKSFDLDSVSPAKLANKLNRPVLVTHGEDDSTVPFSQHKGFMDALKKAGKTADSHIYKDEGHGFTDPANEKDWLDRLEAFLDTHNPADKPSTAATALAVTAPAAQ